MLHRLLLQILKSQGDSGYVCISTKDADTGDWKDNAIPVDNTNRLRKFFKNYPTDNYDLYFCPTLLKGTRRRKANVQRSRLLWADLDHADPNKCDPLPTIAWQTSPGRYAALWVLDKPLSPSRTEAFNKALTYRVGADKSGWDLTQVLRIPNTKNHKYNRSPRGRLLWDDGPTYARAEMERTLKDDLDTLESPGITTNHRGLDPKEVMDRVKKRIPSRLMHRLVQKTVKGVDDRSKVLWKLRIDLLERKIDPADVTALLKASVWNKYRGQRREDEMFEAEMDKALQQIGWQGDEPQQDEGPELAGYGAQDAVTIIPMSEVEPEDVKFLWHPYIPIGKVTLLEGDPGLGKSWLTFALAIAVARGRGLPGQEGHTSRKKVLLMSAEDGIADTIAVRLREMGATKEDRKRILAMKLDVNALEEDMLDRIKIEMEDKSVHPTLLIIDPLVAYMGGALDINKANQTRAFMSGLADWAEEMNMAILGVRHLKKDQSSDKAIHLGTGSVDITGAARSAMIVTEDPEDEDARFIFHIKSNLAKKGPAISYTLIQGEGFRWEGVQAGVSWSSLRERRKELEKGGEENPVLAAMEFLNEELASGPVRSRLIKRNADARGIDKLHLNRAARKAGVVKEKDGTAWTWALP